MSTESKVLWAFLILFSLVILNSLWAFSSPRRRGRGWFLTNTPVGDFFVSVLAVALIWWKFRRFLFP